MVNWKQCKYLCPYCGKVSELVDGQVVYPHRPDLKDLRFYYCGPCQAWVGCHKGSIEPFGRLANAELRRLKQQAHEVFDQLWKKRQREGKVPKGLITRNQAYKLLARHMDKDKHITHIGWFNEEECREVIRWATELLPTLETEHANH